jgi:hypothetical protein
VIDDPTVEVDDVFRVTSARLPTPSISTEYAGRPYAINVDPAATDRSSQVLELVTELLALNNSAKNLPAPSVISIIAP